MFARRRARPIHQRAQSRGIGLARKWPVAADHIVEQIAHPESGKDFFGRRERLVRQHGHARMFARGADDIDNPFIRTRVIEQLRVVDVEESGDRLRASPRYPAAASARRTSIFAPSPTIFVDGVERKRRRAELTPADR